MLILYFPWKWKNLWWSCLRKQLNETQIFKPSGHQTSKRRLMPNGRHIKLNHRNIAFLLQDTTQKYWKHIFEQNVVISLCPFLCLLRICFIRLPQLQRVFSVLGRRTPQNYVEFYTLQVIICAVYSFVYSIDSLWNSYVIW